MINITERIAQRINVTYQVLNAELDDYNQELSYIASGLMFTREE